MADLHIDDFYRDVALILLRLYSTFPRPRLIYVEDLLGPIEVDEFGLPSERGQACFSTLQWLAEEGWLRFDAAIRQEALDQAVLTQHAFLALTAPRHAPDLAASSDTPPSLTMAALAYAAALRRALADGDSLSLGHTVRDLLATATARRIAAY